MQIWTKPLAYADIACESARKCPTPVTPSSWPSAAASQIPVHASTACCLHPTLLSSTAAHQTTSESQPCTAEAQDTRPDGHQQPSCLRTMHVDTAAGSTPLKLSVSMLLCVVRTAYGDYGSGPFIKIYQIRCICHPQQDGIDLAPARLCGYHSGPPLPPPHL